MIAGLVPAAGKSERMGQPKLLIEIEGKPLLGRVIEAVRAGGAEPVVTVTPPANAPETGRLTALARLAGAHVITPEQRPVDMRESIQLALDFLASPQPPDHVLITPADSAGLTSNLIRKLIEIARPATDAIIVPTHQGRRGHPVILPWPLARELHALPRDQGLNALLARAGSRLQLVEVNDPGILVDLDAPGDLEAWTQRTCPTLITHQVRLFAAAREICGRSQLDVALPADSTVADLKQALARCEPRLAPILDTALIAINEVYASDRDLVPPEGAIALIPPVSGGARPNSPPNPKTRP
jgi:molybdenum cofactor cytidylyltransferase